MLQLEELLASEVVVPHLLATRIDASDACLARTHGPAWMNSSQKVHGAHVPLNRSGGWKGVQPKRIKCSPASATYQPSVSRAECYSAS
jgi:hypothetical protein